MENQNYKGNSIDQDKIMERVNQNFDNMMQDVKSSLHDDNQTSQQSGQNVMNDIDDAANVFNNNNPWSDQ